jgi:hypothetical protein
VESSLYRRLTFALSLGAALLILFVASGQAQTVSGMVRERAPLADVAVQAELDGRSLATTTTDAAGRFSFGLGTGVRSTSDVLISFTKSGFRQENRALIVSTATARPLDIVLLPLTGEGAITEAEKKVLDPRRTREGTGPLMFVPYALPAGTTAGSVADLNQRLRNQLQRLILTHVGTALPDADTRGVSLAQLDVTVAADLERLRTYGEYINALAVVSGLGILEGGGTEPTVELASSFVIIPRMQRFEPPVLTIVDVVPASQIGRAVLDQRMSKDWGRATLIALAIRDIKAALPLEAGQRRIALKRVQGYLTTELGSIGAAEVASSRRLQQLLAQVKEELAR